MDFNLRNLFDPVEGDPGLTIPQTGAAIGLPGKPVSDKSVRRYINLPVDPLPVSEVGGKNIIFLSELRAWVLRRGPRKGRYQQPPHVRSRKRRARA